MNKKYQQRIPYCEKLVKKYSMELGILAAECKTRAQFEEESLTFIYGLFDKFDIEAKEYYRLCYIRAVILSVTTWTEDIVEHG